MTARSTSRAHARRSVAGAARARAAGFAVAVLCAAGSLASAPAFAADAASSAAAAPAPGEASAATQVTVKPGQSLNDVAIAVTQSHDRAVLSRASKAIFDANPSAFMRGDPSLMKLGAVLNVPPLDATGAVAQAPVPASAPSFPAAGTAAAASASHGASLASSAGAASAAGASASAHGSAPASANIVGVPPAAGLAAPQAVAPQAASHPQNGAAPASGPATTTAGGGHAWTGSIQPAPSMSAASAASESAAGETGASAPVTASTGASAAAFTASATGASALAPASAVHPHTFSSLQQLLAFKNRVLMDLQRHGFGSKSAREAAAPAPSASSASAVVVPSPAPKPAGPSSAQVQRGLQSGERFIGIGRYGVSVSRASLPTVAAVASAIAAALLVLIVSFAVSGRKRRAARETAASIPSPEPAPAPRAAPAAGVEQGREAAPARAEGPQDPLEAEYLATLARTPTSKRALMGLAAHYAERGNVSGFDEIAQRIMRLSGGRGPNWLHVAALGRQLDPDNPLYAVSGEEAEDTFAEPATEEGVLPPHSAHVQSRMVGEVSEPAADGEHVRSHISPQPDAGTAPDPVIHDVENGRLAEDAAVEQSHTSGEPATDKVLPPAIETAGEAGERHEGHAAVESVPSHEPRTPAPSMLDTAGPAEVESAGEPRFPAEAIVALNELDLGLPPRIETPSAHEPPPVAHENRAADAGAGDGHESEHAHEPEHAYAPALQHTQEPQHAAEPKHTEEPPLAPPLPPAVAGLGAARFGPLKLAFDLDLPVDGAARSSAATTPPQPAFTHEEIARIARNKLELAAEYIELGDLGGARTLIHEVIESNDPATRDEAQALLATLAPLS